MVTRAGLECSASEARFRGHPRNHPYTLPKGKSCSTASATASSQRRLSPPRQVATSSPDTLLPRENAQAIVYTCPDGRVGDTCSKAASGASTGRSGKPRYVNRARARESTDTVCCGSNVVRSATPRCLRAQVRTLLRAEPRPHHCSRTLRAKTRSRRGRNGPTWVGPRRLSEPAPAARPMRQRQLVVGPTQRSYTYGTWSDAQGEYSVPIQLLLLARSGPGRCRIGRRIALRGELRPPGTVSHASSAVLRSVEAELVRQAGERLQIRCRADLSRGRSPSERFRLRSLRAPVPTALCSVRNCSRDAPRMVQRGADQLRPAMAIFGKFLL